MEKNAETKTICDFYSKKSSRDFPGGPVVINPPSKTGDMDLIPGCRIKVPHAAGQLSQRAITEPCSPEPTRAAMKIQHSQN